ncbi:MAG: hypothetical protein HY673_17365 [Chloroflexi bacterium]|nr:hypothetical protein [Chloroflexota bacterium]
MASSTDEFTERAGGLKALAEEMQRFLEDDRVEADIPGWKACLREMETFLKEISALTHEQLAVALTQAEADNNELKAQLGELSEYRPGDLEKAVSDLDDRSAEKEKMEELNGQLNGYQEKIEKIARSRDEAARERNLKEDELKKIEASISDLKRREADLRKEVDKLAKEDIETASVLKELPALATEVREVWAEVRRLEGSQV